MDKIAKASVVVPIRFKVEEVRAYLEKIFPECLFELKQDRDANNLAVSEFIELGTNPERHKSERGEMSLLLAQIQNKLAWY